MPKGKRKGKSDRKFEGSLPSDDESINNDNASIFSNVSENKSIEDDDTITNHDQIDIQDQFEERLIEMIDNLTQKSSQGRINCFNSVSKAFVSKYIPQFIIDRTFTLCDSIERALKKGGTEERSAAADLASIICVQVGFSEDASQTIYKSLKPVLITTALNNAVSPAARGKCCLSLSIITYLSGAELGDILAIMQQFESIFSGSFLKGDGSTPNVLPDVAGLHSMALSAWGLLLLTIDQSSVILMSTETKTLPTIYQFGQLLESAHLDIRMTAGEVLALLYEIGRVEEDDDFCDSFDSILDRLKDLATDSHKYRAKKDRKQQRATFRDVLVYIEEGVYSDVQVKFGREILVLDSWSKRKQYDMMCSILGPGINIHLGENEFFRDLFDITEPIQVEDNRKHEKQASRYHKRIVNAANFKARTLLRAKNRDKKSDF